MNKFIERTKRGFSYIDRNLYGIIIFFLVLLNIAPILAPIFAALKLTWFAQAIYFVYSFFCHQLDWRSLHVADYQYAWCVRDTFIWLNILIIAILVSKYEIKPIKWYWLIPFVIPIAMDGGIQTIATVFGFVNREPFYISTDLLRMFTGGIFGLGFGLWIMPNLWETNGLNIKRKYFKFNQIKLIIIVLTFNIILYITQVAIWDWTSSKYKPSNFLDYSAKTPTNTQDWLIRKAHGI